MHYIRKNYGFVPHNLDYYEEALRHSSASFVNAKGHKFSNERLEYLGDAILDAIVAEYLYHKFAGLQEGKLTKMKAKVVSRINLNAIGLDLNLPEQIVCNMGKQDLHHSIVGNAFEAMIGAIYLDKGFKVTKRITIRILEKYGLSVIVHEDFDFK
ncbi:MAG: ribonuclease III family protein, partial [Saprospiraceae bacterium]